VGTRAPATSVSALVRARMGRRVLERLVAPVVGGVHSADPEVLDIDMVAPGLRAGIRSHGSLAAAVAAQRSRGIQRSGGPAPASSRITPPEGLQKAGSAVAGLRGGMHTLVSALLAELRGQGVTLLAGTRADSVERTASGWRVSAGGTAHDAGLLVVAVEGPAAVGLLAGALPGLAARRPDAGPDVSLVTLVVHLPELDARPRGTGVLVAPQSPGIQAKALTHATAKWGWLAEQTGPGTHVLRLSYGRGDARHGARQRPEPRTDDELFQAALQDASALLSAQVTAGNVVDWDVVRWGGALPFASLGHKQRVAEVRRICADDGTVAVVGGWLSGNGLAAIAADTPDQVRQLLS
jgi:oxygen-dependent protoporphyrinogen oxidase